ncbi:hypothetical protein MPH_02281 [Macrophomina phaseolina MS6]|uniref:Uncharacterized protein n=1 Tax=Macrophomina phaseolina (strain MS6) TaxID=1126212 RepID=K2RCV3_MACPH|nr:hypothetical protein MPH_02281 [Macrophomina phaseolina MS6]
MNWTGGTLQRHSNNNPLTRRQKRHFAKLRAHVHHKDPANGSSPFVPRFLQPGEAEYEALDGASGRQPLKRQKALDQYETVAPLAQRLSALKPHPPTYRHISRRNRRGSPNAATHSPLASREGNLSLSLHAVVVSHANANNGRKTQAQKEYDMPESYRKQNFACNNTWTDEAVQCQRDILLARRDWAGLEPSSPVRMRFPSSQEREALGKRHKTFRNRTHRTSRDGATRMPFLEGAETELGGPWMSRALMNRNDIDIKIGPNAIATHGRAAANDSHEAGCSLTPSDPMLFEIDGAVQELQPLRTPNYLATVSPFLEQEKEGPSNLVNLPDTDPGPRESCGSAEADPVKDVERLSQELDGCSYRAPGSLASTRTAVLAHAQRHHRDMDDGVRRKSQVLGAWNENLMQMPTSLRKLEPGREGSSLAQAETRGRTKGKLELQTPPGPPKALPATVYGLSEWTKHSGDPTAPCAGIE